MSVNVLEIIDTNVQKIHLWLKEVRTELHTENPNEAYQALRAVLHTLRDRLTVEETSDFAAQLPIFVKGLFFDGWKAAGKPEKLRNRQEFLDVVNSRLTVQGPVNPERYVRAVFAVVSRHVSAGELEDVQNSLPGDLRPLWPEVGTSPEKTGVQQQEHSSRP